MTNIWKNIRSKYLSTTVGEKLISSWSSKRIGPTACQANHLYSRPNESSPQKQTFICQEVINDHEIFGQPIVMENRTGKWTFAGLFSAT
jgi:hypothetical protein